MHYLFPVLLLSSCYYVSLITTFVVLFDPLPFVIDCKSLFSFYYFSFFSGEGDLSVLESPLTALCLLLISYKLPNTNTNTNIILLYSLILSPTSFHSVLFHSSASVLLLLCVLRRNPDTSHESVCIYLLYIFLVLGDSSVCVTVFHQLF
jgi:hypothetical protein